MTPNLYPHLVNSRFGDPALYVDLKFEKRALLIDLGDLHGLPAKKLLRLTDVFVSHAHLDHFIGFDQMLRVLLGRNKRVRLYGPEGLADRVEHKLAGYAWNLLDRFTTDLVFTVTEIHDDNETCIALFSLQDRFDRAEIPNAKSQSGPILEDDTLRVHAAVLDHGIPCLAYAIEERAHINVWKTGLEEMGLPVGPWLRELKRAVLLGLPDSTPIPVPAERGEDSGTRTFALGDLKEKAIRITRGQKIAYVVDALYNDRNAERIVDLARDADLLFIEATFAQNDAARAADRRHLTTVQAGHLARLANVRDVVPFQFSPRYAGQETQLLREVDETFRGEIQCPPP